MANYRYFVNDAEVFPLNAGTSIFKYEKKDNAGVIYDRSIDKALTFKYNDVNFNFKTQESTNKCEELNFRVHRRCGSSWAIFWEGVFSIIEGDFDDDNCVFKIKPRMKEYVLADLQINFLDDPIKVDEGSVIGVKATSPDTSGYSVYPNCRYFDHFLLYIAKKANPKINKVISNFFQINPDGPFYIPGVTNYWSKMAVSAISEVQYPVPSNPATREYISFNDLMNDLNTLFKVNWFIDTNYNLRVEHDLYFEGDIGLDLTQAKYDTHLKGKNKFSYDLSEYVKKETWSIAGHSNLVSLVYGGLSNVGKNTSEKIYSTNVLKTDYQEIVFGSADSGDGIFLFATDGGSLSGEWRMLEGAGQNFKLMPGVLVQSFHRFNKPSFYSLYYETRKSSVVGNYILSTGGIINESIKPTKTQDEFVIPLCCEDSFNVYDKVKTKAGLGIVDGAEFDSKNETLKLKLKYKTINCSDFNPLTDIGSMALWLKYNEGITAVPTTPGFLTGVSQWDDMSGNGRHAVQGTVANQPSVIYQTATPVWFSNAFSIPRNQFLVTPAFQLFPNKRGTIIFLLDKVYAGEYGGSSSQGASGDTPILSTNNGGAGTYYDISLNGSKYYTYNESKFFPQNDYYPTLPHGLFVVVRPADLKVYTNHNNLAPINNPLVVANLQPTVEQLIIGGNLTLLPTQAGDFMMYEMMVFDKELTDREIEMVQLYLTKKLIYKLYNP